MVDEATTGEATQPAIEPTRTLAEAVKIFEGQFEEVDDEPTQTNDSHAPNGAVYERYTIPGSMEKNPKPKSFETQQAAINAWLHAVTLKFTGKKLWWRARPRIIAVQPGEGVTVYCSLAVGN